MIAVVGRRFWRRAGLVYNFAVLARLRARLAAVPTTRVAERSAAGAVLVLVAVRCAIVLGEFPPGLDEANMLLFGRRLLGGPDLIGSGPRGDVLVPLLLVPLSTWVGPLPAAQAVALGSFCAVLIAHYLLARRGLPPPFAAAVAALAAACPGTSEPTLGGAYQQNLAFASMILLAAPTVAYLESGALGTAAWISAGLVAVTLTHWAYTPIALAAMAATALLARGGAAWTRLGLTLAAAPALVLWVASSLRILREGYVVPNEWTGGAAGIWWHVFRGPGWTLAAAAGLVALGLDRRLSRSKARTPALALLAAGIVATIAVPHPRAMPPVVAAALIGLGLLLKQLIDAQPTAARSAMVAASATALAAVLLLRADREAAGMREWYRTLDRDYLALAAWVRDEPSAPRVAANAGAAGQPSGVWIAVLTGRPVLVGADPGLLAFPSDLARARVVASLFEPRLSWAEAAGLASARGVGILVSAKDALPQWRDWMQMAGPDALESGRFVAFRVRSGAQPGAPTRRSSRQPSIGASRPAGQRQDVILPVPDREAEQQRGERHTDQPRASSTVAPGVEGRQRLHHEAALGEQASGVGQGQLPVVGRILIGMAVLEQVEQAAVAADVGSRQHQEPVGPQDPPALLQAVEHAAVVERAPFPGVVALAILDVLQDFQAEDDVEAGVGKGKGHAKIEGFAGDPRLGVALQELGERGAASEVEHGGAGPQQRLYPLESPQVAPVVPGLSRVRPDQEVQERGPTRPARRCSHEATLRRPDPRGPAAARTVGDPRSRPWA